MSKVAQVCFDSFNNCFPNHKEIEVGGLTNKTEFWSTEMSLLVIVVAAFFIALAISYYLKDKGNFKNNA